MTALMLIPFYLAGPPDPTRDNTNTIRFATFNIWELTSVKLASVDDQGLGTCPQLRNAAEIIQRARPDVLLIAEIDFDAEARHNAQLFLDRYLHQPHGGQAAIDYPYVFFAPVNTGVSSGRDLDHDGRSDGPEDAFGFGTYPGQYGMALLSRYPIVAEHVRTFSRLLWKNMPDNLLPDGTSGKPAWYDAESVAILRLSSKSHWDVPIRLGDATIHVLCSHPTPPVFDGPEDRNGRRNFDEIRLWADYLTGQSAAEYIVDDAGRKGGLPPGERFVILGDLNADPLKEPATYRCRAIEQLLNHPRVRDTQPASAGALGGRPAGPPQYLERKTCEFGRIDYVLPSHDLRCVRSGAFWPERDSPLFPLVSDREASSDHRLVWADLVIPPR